MTILLRFYFVGMIAFLPGGVGDPMTVLLPDLRNGYAASDRKLIESHTAFLVVRAGGCVGDCTADQETIAEMLYDDLSQGRGEPMELLRSAVRGGGVWKLAGSELVIESVQPQPSGLRIVRGEEKRLGPVPTTLEERRSFDWVADLGKIVPASGEIDPGVLGDRPRRGALVARLKLSAGEVRTHRMTRIGDDVPVIDFKTLHSDRVLFSQALAHWVTAEVPVQVQDGDCKVRLAERSLVDGGGSRVMELAPERCEEGAAIDVAILNVPASSFKPFPRPPADSDRIGRHFEVYYELSKHPPARRDRPVPHLGEGPRAPWKVLHPKAEESSDFLESIVIPSGKGVANPLLCPPAKF